MKNIAAAVFGLYLICASVSASAAEEIRNAPGKEQRGLPRELATAGSCAHAIAGERRTGYVASVGTSWFGTNNTTIAFKDQLSSDNYSIESSGYFTDTAEGSAQLTSLVSAYLAKVPVTLYCSGKNPKTGRDSFTYLWVGHVDAP
ncbi:hypothetical protein [Bordetella bronchialis]|uniref:hypothetical protein n=1 Tax=Bordetella bronchialis TaxID=463025 RepID=UPI000ADB33B3|nr:hypothetical protein [Bordetella bronchialis]